MEMGPGLPAVGRALRLRVGLSLKWLLLVWRQALPRGGAASPGSSPFRCVWIEKESINSVIISDSPEDAHQRLLVAASLSVNTTGEWGAAPPALLPAGLQGSTSVLRSGVASRLRPGSWTLLSASAGVSL